MTIAELIVELQKHDPSAVIVTVGVEELVNYAHWEDQVQVIKWEDIDDPRNASKSLWQPDYPEGTPIVAVFGGIFPMEG